MKKIKKFVDYIRESHGWEFIRVSDYFDNRPNILEDDNFEKEDFSKLLNDISVTYKMTIKEFKQGNSFQLLKPLLDIYVSRSADQYYFVGLNHNTYFKADQLDGLKNLLTLIINYTVWRDDFYPTEFGKRFYVMMDDKPSYFTINKNGEMTGNNNVKQAIVRDMEDKGLLNNSNRQEITSGVAEYLRGYK